MLTDDVAAFEAEMEREKVTDLSKALFFHLVLYSVTTRRAETEIYTQTPRQQNARIIVGVWDESLGIFFETPTRK